MAIVFAILLMSVYSIQSQQKKQAVKNDYYEEVSI